MDLRILAVSFLAFSFSFPAVADDGGMQGEPEALAMAAGIVEAIGGKQIWAPMRSLYVREMARTPGFPDEIAEEVWRDLEQPRARFRLRSSVLDRKRAWDENQGWALKETGEFTIMAAEDVATEVAFWPGDVYIMYHRLAKEDAALTLSLDEAGRLQISEDGVSRGWFQVDVNGEPIKWGLKTEMEEVEYVFGPLKAFGDINFPAWGSATDVSWRYWYTDVVPSNEPPVVEFTPPEGMRGQG